MARREAGSLFMLGKTLGHYEILEQVGAGGMGEVYRARDKRLDRAVAIKVLPERFSAHDVLRERFEREARTISQLNHPHICALYDIGEHDGVNFLVMEYLEGETLEKRLSRGPLPPEQALRLGVEIAEALDRAHRQGIIHRDLKPGNIMLTKAGAKLLDFGLAKFKVDAVPVSSALTEMATESRKLTGEGTLLGTLQYMAPEQLEGKEADGRADIFALGAVLFEMVTGRAAFTGKSQASLIAAILASDPPPLATLQPMTPPALDRVVKQCLAKDPDERWQTARDLAAELKWIANPPVAAASSPPGVAHRKRRNRERLAWALAAVFLAAAVAGLAAYLRLRNSPAPLVVTDISAPKGAQFAFVAAPPPALSPDGRALVFAARDASNTTRLWVRRLDSASAQPLPGTEDPASAFWSPDGRRIAFYAHHQLQVIEASGGQPLVLSDAPATGGAAWNREGTILFAQGNEGIYRLAATGGAPVQVIAREASRYAFYMAPRFLPDGKHFLYVAANPGFAGDTYYASLDGKENRSVIPGGGRAVYSSGFLIHGRGASLEAEPFDPESGQLKGAAHRIVDQVRIGTFFAVFDASDNGVLIYEPTGRAATETQLAWFGRDGKRLGLIGAPGVYYDLRLAPDGHRLAFSAGNPKSEIWADDLVRGLRMRLTFDPDTDKGIPVWSPDGNRLLFATLRGGKARIGLYEKASDGASGEKLLVASDAPDREWWATDWSRDGRFLLLSRGDMVNSAKADIWVLPLTGDGKSSLFLSAAAAVYDGHFSPDGRWVAYTSRESGRTEVYVVPFDAARYLKEGRGNAGPAGKWEVSTEGGNVPRWRRDGRELYYLTPDNHMMAVEVEGKGASFQVGRSQPLFLAPTNPFELTYDVAPDGKRFVMSFAPEEDNDSLALMLNWTSLLKSE